MAACASIILPLVVSSCGGNNGRNDTYGEEGLENIVETAPGSVRDKVPEDPYISLPTADSAMRFMKESGHWDDYSNGILPSMTETALKYVEKLVNSKHRGFVVADKERMRVIYFDRYGNERYSFPMACSRRYGTKHKRRDNRTPEGFFSVYKVYDSTDWLYTDDDGRKSEVKGQFGPRFIRLRIPGTSQIGIHGTCAPWSLGGRRSHGCIRVSNEDIMTLVELVDSGMPVIVSPGSRDIAVNESEGYFIPAISTRPGIPPADSNRWKEYVRASVEDKSEGQTDSIVTEPVETDRVETSESADSINGF